MGDAAVGRWGGITFVMVLWAVVVAVCDVPAWYAPGWCPWATSMAGFLVAGGQWDAARMNATGRHPWFAGGCWRPTCAGSADLLVAPNPRQGFLTKNFFLTTLLISPGTSTEPG